jgi:hypothetical protein
MLLAVLIWEGPFLYFAIACHFAYCDL